MANLENNYDKEKDQSPSEEISLESAKKLVKDAVEYPAETVKEFTEQAGKDVVSVKWWAKLLLILFWTGLFILVTLLVVVNLNVTKQWAANQALQILNQDFKAKTTTQSVHVDYFGDVTIRGLTIEDYKGLKFIKAREFRANSDWLRLASNAISGNNNSLSFDALTLTNADIKIITYKGDSISNFIRYINNFDSGKKKDPTKPSFQLNSRVEIIDSKVSIVNRNSEGDAGKWLTARKLNLKAPSLKVNGGDVAAMVNNLSFETERYGKKHFVDTFSTNLALTKKHLHLKDVTINTDHSLLQGDIKFKLNNGSWSDFTNKVRWEMELNRGSHISGYDISYFVTDWDNYKPVNVSGKMRGPLNNFYLNNFVLGNREVNIATGTAKFANLLNGNFLIETNTLSTDLTYIDLKAMMPTFISEKMKNFADDFGRLKYNGAARVTPQQVFIPKGNLVTSIGQAKISNFYLEDYSSNLPRYRGYAEVNDLNTSVITKNNQVGLISGKFNLDGQSFDVNTMRLETRSQISKIEILNKEINNIFLDGLLDHKTYNGIINVNDEQAKADIAGFIDFRTSKILADVKANVKHLNLNYFSGGSGTQIVSGLIDGQIAMTNLNDMDLDADVTNFAFNNGSDQYLIPKAQVKVFFENGNRIVSVDAPNAVNGQIAGKFNLEDLSGMIENGLNKILVGPAPRKMYRGQSFTMDFDVKQNLVNYFMPDLRIPKGAKIDGSYDGNSNNLVLNLDAQELIYLMTKEQEISDADKALAKSNPDYKINERDLITKDSAMIENVIVRINTANLEEQIFAKINRAEFNKNIFKDITLTGKNENNQLLRIAANFQHGSPDDEINQEMKSYAININQSTNENGDYVVRFDPTEVKFNEVIWAVDTNINHTITYRKKEKDFQIKNLRVFSDESEVLINEAEFKNAKDFYANADVKNLQIGKLFEMQDGGNLMDLKGIANGNINIRMHKNNLEPIVDLTVDNITMNDEDLGNLTINAKNSSTPNVFDVEAKVVSAGIIGDNNLEVTGTIDNNTPSPTLDIKADMDEFDLKFANQFVEGIFSNMRGKATGILAISGTLSDIDYSGDIGLENFGLKLDFTGVDYSFDDTTIQLSRGLAILNDIGVKDARSNSSGTISGAIQFETLSSMGVNLVMRADDLMMLDTSQKDYDLFWGRIYGSGDLFVDGPVKALNISTPNMKALRNSVFTFNSNSTSNVEEFKMLRFLKQDKLGVVTLEERKKSGANMNIDFSLEVDKGTTVNVLVGDEIGDISVRGESDDLNFQMNRNGNIYMSGSYFVDNGTFTSRAVLNRTFQIEKGSNIRWDGDAMSPALDITANYLRQVSNAGAYLNLSLQPINVMLQTRITETLNNPDIELDVIAIDVTSQVKETLSAKMNQEEERVIQFGSILLMNQFNVTNSGGLNVNVASVAEDSGYNLLLKQLGSVLNTISSEFQVDLNYVKGDAASNTEDRASAAVKLSLSPRVTVKTGLGVPLSSGSENTTQNYLSGEGIVEYDISKNNDGTLILRGYSKPSNIGMVGGANSSANQAYGAGVVWSKSFNSIFKRKKNKNQKKTDNNPPAINDSIKNAVIK